MAPLLQSSELLHVLEQHMLPYLSLWDLAKMACTNTSLRRLAYQSPSAWHTAATECLPPRYPQLAPAIRVAGVQAVMQHRATAISNALSPQSESQQQDLPLVRGIDDQPVSWVGFSHDGTRMAILSTQHLSMVECETGNSVWRVPVSTYGPVLGITSAVRLLRLGMFLKLEWVAGAHIIQASLDQLQRLDTPELSSCPPSLQLFRIDAQNGKASTALSVQLDDFCGRAAHVPWSDNVWQSIQTFVSPGAGLVAFLAQQSSNQQARAQAVYMCDAATGILIVPTPIWQSSQLGNEIDDQFLWSPDGTILATSQWIYDASALSIKDLQHPFPFVAAAFEQHGKYFGGSTSFREPHAAAFDTSSGAVLLERNDVFFCCFCSTQARVILKTGNDIDSHLQVWDLHQQQCMHSFSMPDPAPYADCGIVNVECILRDRVLAVSLAGWIVFLDAASGMPRRRVLTSATYRRIVTGPDECCLVSHACSRRDDTGNILQAVAGSVVICKLA